MASETIDPAASGRNTVVTADTKKTVETVCYGTDGTTSRGTIRTTIQTSGSGAALRVTATTSDSASLYDDSATCAELIELAADKAAHWVAVKQTLEAMAQASGSGSGSGSGS